MPDVEPPEPTRLGEVVWLEPISDALLARGIDVPPGPEARYEQNESISLAFVTALQVLPPRQVAVLVLRDVLGFRADEVADMLDSTVQSVNSARKRARAGLRHQRSSFADREPAPASGSPAEDAIVARFVRTWEGTDLVPPLGRDHPDRHRGRRDCDGVDHPGYAIGADRARRPYATPEQVARERAACSVRSPCCQPPG